MGTKRAIGCGARCRRITLQQTSGEVRLGRGVALRWESSTRSPSCEEWIPEKDRGVEAYRRPIGGYSRKLGAVPAGTGAPRPVFRARPTTPITFTSEQDVRGTNMRRALPWRSGGVSCTPFSRRSRRSLAMMLHMPRHPGSGRGATNLRASGRLRKVLRSGSYFLENSRTK